MKIELPEYDISVFGAIFGWSAVFAGFLSEWAQIDFWDATRNLFLGLSIVYLLSKSATHRNKL